MTAIPRLDPLAVRLQDGAGLRGMRLSPLPPRMIVPCSGETRDGRSRRTKIWELSHHLHCSIVGTCLSTGELRQVLCPKEGARGRRLPRARSAPARRPWPSGQQRAVGQASCTRPWTAGTRTADARFDKAQATSTKVRAEWREARQARRHSRRLLGRAMTHPAASERWFREIIRRGPHAFAPGGSGQPRRRPAAWPSSRRRTTELRRQARPPAGPLRDGITRREPGDPGV